MNNFNPKIDRSVFKKIILGKQENEGNNNFVVKKIYEELEISSGIYFFEQFINICKKYNIEFKNNINLKSYEVIIITNGYESHKFEYNDEVKDITVEFAKILYRQLSIQIMNEKFIDDAKKNYR
jgi:hypothetical protein